MSYLQPMFDGELAPGIYQLISRAKADSLFGDMTEQGWRGFYIDASYTDVEGVFLRLGGVSMAAGLAMICRTADRAAA